MELCVGGISSVVRRGKIGVGVCVCAYCSKLFRFVYVNAVIYLERFNN